MKWIVLTYFVLFFMSCSNDMNNVQLKDASLKCMIVGGEVEKDGGANNSALKSGYYKRNSAPAYISGIVLTAENTEYEVPNVVRQFNFNPNGQGSSDKDIVLEGLTVGNNEITAQGVCNSPSQNNYYQNIGGTSGNLNERATNYSNNLLSIQPVYADYKSAHAANVVISNGGNSTNISMVTQNHRVAVILENPSKSNYLLSFDILEQGKDNPLLSSGSNRRLTPGTQHAMVINDRNAKGNKRYIIRVNYYTIGSGVWVGQITKTIDAAAYDNIAKLYHFNKGGLEVGNATISWINWTPMDKITGGETIS